MVPFILAFMVCGVLNWGYTYTLGFLLIAVCYPILKRRSIIVNFLTMPSLWILCAFGLTYVVFGEHSFDNIQNTFILPVVAYIIGWCSFEQGGRDSCAATNNILGITFGFALHAALNYLANIGNTNRGLLIDFWNGGYWSATGSGFLNTMIFSLLVYFLFIEKRCWIKVSFGILTLACVLYMLMLGNRTQLLILFVVSIMVGTLYLLERGSWDSLAKSFAGVCALIIIFAVCYHLNILGLSDLLTKSNLAARFLEGKEMTKSNIERITQFIAGIRNLYRNPLGGQKSQLYFHNMWLDICRIAGLIPMGLMILFNIVTIRNATCLFRDKRIDIRTRYLIISVYTGCLMNCFVEPVLEGLVSFFLSFCLVNGITDSMYFSCRLSLQNQNLGS